MSRPAWNLYSAAVQLSGPQAGATTPEFLRYLQSSHALAETGTVGAQGEAGATGATGPGVAAGGTTGQVLKKASATDYDTGWITLAAVALTGAFADLVSHPTTAAGYGITGGASLDSLAGLSTTGKFYYLSATSTWTAVNIGSGVAFSGGTLSATGTGGTVTSVGLTSTDFTVSGSPVTTSGSITANLATQAGITAAAYGDASHSLTATVNGKGVLTALSAQSIAIGWSQITSGKPTTLSGYGITDAQPIDSDLTAIAALTTTSYGRGLLTSASATALMNGLSATDLTTGTLPDGRLSNTITAGSSGDASHTTALAFDAHGRLTAATPTAIAIPWSAITSGVPTTLSGYGITDAVSSTATRAANLVFAGPTTGAAAAPTFRSLVAADIPSLSGNYQAVSTYLTNFVALSWTTGTQVPVLTAANTWGLKLVGSSTGNLLDKAAGDTLYLGIGAAASYALLASPAFTGTPTAPIAGPGTNTTQIATTSFVATSFAPLASPTLTGTPAAPTAVAGTNSTQIATTAFVATATAAYAPLASPVLTGTPTAPTAAVATNTTQLATTAFVQAAASPLAPLASPALTGTPTTPTAALLTNTTQIASTAFVQSALGAYQPAGSYLTSANNLSDVASAATARQNLSTQVANYNLAGTDANATLSIATRSGTYIHNVTLTADRTYTLSATGAYAGMRWRMVRKGAGAFNWIIKDQAAGATIKNLATNQWMDVEFDGTSWQEVAFGSL